MKLIKIIIYIALIAIMISPLGYENIKLVFFVFLGLIYFDAKDPNIRSLIMIIAMVEFIFYELDYLFYILGKYYWDTGPILGDVILDIVILLSIMATMASVYYRSEIMDGVRRVCGLKEFDYLPTRADLAVIFAMRAIGIYHLSMLAVKIFIVHKYNVAVEGGELTLAANLYKEIADFGRFYVEWGFKVELIKYVALVMSLHAWLKEYLKHHRPEYGVLKA